MITFLQAFAGFAAAELLVVALLLWHKGRQQWQRVDRLETTLRLTVANVKRRERELVAGLADLGIHVDGDAELHEIHHLQASYDMPAVQPERGEG